MSVSELSAPGTFAIVGVQKSGTTALSSFLDQHPDVCMAKPMETHFFDRARYFEDGAPPYEAFHHTVFGSYRGETAVGWSTPSIMFVPAALRRLADYNPAIRLIVLLRHPAERAYSHYRMQVADGSEWLPLREALQREPQRLSEGCDFGQPGLLYSYLSRGLYHPQVERILRTFDRSQVLFIDSDRLLGDHEATLARVCDFVGVDPPAVAPGERRVHVGPPGAMDPDDRRLMVALYADTVASVEDRLGWNLEQWRS